MISSAFLDPSARGDAELNSFAISHTSHFAIRFGGQTHSDVIGFGLEVRFDPPGVVNGCQELNGLAIMGD